MRIILIIITISLIVTSNSYANYLNEYKIWLTDNNQNKYLPLSKKLTNNKDKLGERFKWDSNPTLEELHYQVFHYLEDDKGFSKQETIGSENP